MGEVLEAISSPDRVKSFVNRIGSIIKDSKSNERVRNEETLRAGSSISRQFSSVTNAACQSNSSVTYVCVRYHADLHEQWKGVTQPVFLLRKEKRYAGFMAPNVVVVETRTHLRLVLQQL